MNPQIIQTGKSQWQLIDAATGSPLTKKHNTRWLCYREYKKEQEAKKCEHSMK